MQGIVPLFTVVLEKQSLWSTCKQKTKQWFQRSSTPLVLQKEKRKEDNINAQWWTEREKRIRTGVTKNLKTYLETRETTKTTTTDISIDNNLSETNHPANDKSKVVSKSNNFRKGFHQRMNTRIQTAHLREREDMYGWTHWTPAEIAKVAKWCKRNGAPNHTSPHTKWMPLYKTFPNKIPSDVRRQVYATHSKRLRNDYPTTRLLHRPLPKNNCEKYSSRYVRNMSSVVAHFDYKKI